MKVWLPASLLLVGLWAIYACFHHSRDWNTASRLLLTYAIVQEGTPEITSFVTRDGKLLANPPTWDLGSPGEDRYFTEKAPGQSLLGVLPYWLMLRLTDCDPHPAPGDWRLEAGGWSAEVLKYWPADYWVTWATSGLVTAATAVLLLLFLRNLGVPCRSAMAIGLAYGLATIALPYATLFYGHTSAGFFCLLSLFLIHRHSRSIPVCLLAGASAGCAVVIEYPMAVYPVSVLTVIAVALMLDKFISKPSGSQSTFRFSGWSAFLLGGVPLAVGLGYYHYLVTGSPFRFPYSNVINQFQFHREHAIPIGWPDPHVMYELLFGIHRGMFWYSPILLVAIPGSWFLVRRREVSLAAICLVTFLGLFWINAGFPAWDGGLATGPRFLLPAVPLLMLAVGVWFGTPCAEVRFGSLHRCLKFLWTIVAITSGLVLVALNAAGARIPPDMHPLEDYLFPVFRAGDQEPHLGEWISDAIGVSSGSGLPGLVITETVIIAAVVGLLAVARGLHKIDHSVTFARGGVCGSGR